jgi:hypothetical protein
MIMGKKVIQNYHLLSLNNVKSISSSIYKLSRGDESMYIRIIKKIALFIVCVNIVITITSLVLYYSYAPEINNWQINNNKKEFVLKGYIVDYKNRLDDIDRSAILNEKIYINALVIKGSEKGIPGHELKEALVEVKQSLPYMLPVFVQTVEYKNKPCFAIVCKYFPGNSLYKKLYVDKIPIIKLLDKNEPEDSRYGVILYNRVIKKIEFSVY